MQELIVYTIRWNFQEFSSGEYFYKFLDRYALIRVVRSLVPRPTLAPLQNAQVEFLGFMGGATSLLIDYSVDYLEGGSSQYIVTSSHYHLSEGVQCTRTQRYDSPLHKDWYSTVSYTVISLMFH